MSVRSRACPACEAPAGLRARGAAKTLGAVRGFAGVSPGSPPTGNVS